MTDNAEQQGLSEPQSIEQVVPPQVQLDMMKNALLSRGLSQYQAYRLFLRNLPIEPGVLAALLQKLDDTWVWARVVVNDMQMQPPSA